MCLARLSSTQNNNAASLSVKSNPGKSVRGRRELKYVQIMSQNTQGFNADKGEIILALMQQKTIFAYGICYTRNMKTWQRDLRKIWLLYNSAWIILEYQKRSSIGRRRYHSQP